MQSKKKLKIWRWFLLILLLVIVYQAFSNNFSLQKTITIKEGDTFQNLIEDLSWKNKMQIKFYLYRQGDKIDFSKLQMGSYIFSGNYSPVTFVETILKWPKISYQTIKILEWWSIYDIDNALANKWLISAGEYINFVSNIEIIGKYQQKYPFLQQLKLKNLEGFLYPDTYKVDEEKNIIDQLVYLQLETFKKKVWNTASSITLPAWLDWYGAIILASIVEKEEKIDANRPIVAWILLKRYQLWTLVGADISLCYFFEMPYSDCTPSFIASKVQDNENPYNTRRVKWLPPTPVSNPSASSIFAAIQPQMTEYFYYLHDNKGQIYYGKTLEEHNQNKKNYIQ